MVAVAAEAVSRLLFFELALDPELLARLFVLYFEKRSAADPAADPRHGETGEQEGGGEEERDAEGNMDAKAVGGSVRLSQVCACTHGLFGALWFGSDGAGFTKNFSACMYVF